jgi:thioredoxin-dependent peroxiredoxin
MLKVGDKAPEFQVMTDEGKDVSLSDFRGKRVLLFFFPKANTSG